MPELFQDTFSSSLIPTKVASEISGYNADYLARLCREKKIEGTQIGRSWLINRSSLEAFVAEQEDRKKQRAEELRAQRGKEYRKAQKPVLKAALSKTADMRDLVTRSVADGVTASRTRAEGFARAAQHVVRSRPHSTQYTHSPRLAALAVALAVVAGSAYASTDARTLSFVNAVPNHLVRIAFHLSPGTVRSSSFRITEADAPANLAASVPTVPSAHDASRAVALLMPNANVAALASVRELADNARTPFAETDVASVAAARIASASSIAQHPLSSLVRAYVHTGESFYDVGATIANAYTAGITAIGDRSLTRAATLRDGIAFLPHVTNAILDGYANGVYAFDDAATKAPGTAMLALYTLGDSISSRAASVPVFALRAQDTVIANAGETAHVGALALARTSSNVQAPLAAVSAAPATQKTSSTAAAPASSSFATTLTRPFTSLYTKATSFEGAILSLPVQAENTMLGFAGYASSLLDGNEVVVPAASSASAATQVAIAHDATNASTTVVVPNSSLSASALSFLPALWQFVFPHFFHSASVLASSFFTSAFHSLTNIVPGGTVITPTLTVLHTGPTETLALPIPANVTHGGGSSGIAYVDTGSHTVVQNIINNYFPGAIVGGAFNDAVLAVVRPFVNDSINASLKNNRGGGSSSSSNTSGSTGGVNSDGATLTNVTISSGTATLSTLTSSNSSLGTASASSLGVTGTTSLATTTVTGDLTVTGTFNVGTLAVSNLSSNSAVIAPYFTATSTSATSTFPNLSATNADLTALHTGQLTLGTSAFTSLLGTGLANVGGVLTVSTSSFSGAGSNFNADLLDGYDAAYLLANSFSTSSADAWLTNETTDALAEGTTSLYFTNARARAALSVTGTGLSYSSTTGALAIASGYEIPLSASTTEWSTAYLNRITAANAPLSITNNTLSISQASASTDGYLSSADWNAFNSKQAALAFTYPLLNTANTISLAFGTSTSNTWGGTQVFTNAPILGSLTGFLKASAGVLSASLIDLSTDVSSTLPVSHGGTGSTSLTGLLKGNGTSAILSAVSGVDYAPATSGASLLYGNNAGGFSNAAVGAGLSFTGGTLTNTIAYPFPSDATSTQIAFNGGLKLGNITGTTQCLRVDSAGVISGAGADCGTTSGGLTTVTSDYPLVGLGTTGSHLSLAFGTSTSNTWGGTQMFTNAPVLGSLTGVIYGNSGTLATTGTSTPTLGTGLSYSGTLGSFLGGTNGTLSISTSTISGSGSNFNADFLDGLDSTYLLANSFSSTSAAYYLAQNAISGFSTTSANYWLTGKTTTDLAEGTNLYYTDARVDARINATSTIGTLTSAPNLGTVKTSLTGILKATSGVLSNAVAGTDYENPLTFGYPLVRTTNSISLAFGTTTANSWSALQTFNGGVKVGSLSGVLYGNSGTVASAATSTATLGTGLSYSGTLGAFVGGTSGTLSVSTSSFSGVGSNFNADLLDGLDSTYFLANSFSTTSAAYWKTQNNFYSTTSADYWLTGKTTTNLAEGSNLYFTNARADARINATSTIGTLTSAPNLGTLSTTLTGILKATSGVLSNAVAGTDYENPLTFTYPLQRTTNTISLAFGTTTANSWSALQTFSAGINVGVSTFTSLLGTGLSNVGGTLSIATSSFSGAGSNFNADLLDGLDSTYFLANSFSTTSANYYKSQNNFYSTTSADYWLTGKTTDNLTQGSTNKYYSDTLATANFVSNLAATTSVASITTLGNLSLPLTQTTGTLAQGRGGTGITTYTAGDILYADNSGNLAVLPVGSTGQVLKVQAGLPSWGVDQTIGGGGSDGIFATSSGKIYPLDTSNVLLIGTNATSTANSIFEVNGIQYISSKLGIGTTSPSVALSVGGNGLFSGTVTAGNIIGSGLTTNSILYADGSKQLASATLGTGLSFSGGALSVSTTSVSGSGSNFNADLLDGLDSTYFLANAFSTTSANYWKGQNNFYSTTSADYWLTGKTTDNLAEGTTNLYWTNTRFDNRLSATTSLPNLTTLANLGTVKTSLTGILKATSGVLSNAVAGTDYENPLTFGYPLVRTANAISLAFGTTTANSWSALQTFGAGVNVGASTFTSLLGTGLSNVGGTLSIATSSFSGAGSNFNADLLDGLDSTYFLANAFSTTSAAYWKTQNNFYSTTSADYWLTGKTTTNLAEGTNLYYTDARVNTYVAASTTIPKTYTSNVFSGNNTFNGSLSIGTLNGPLQANNGVVSATSSVGVLYGGTGLTSAPTYGQVLVGNGSGGYSLTATSSLGLAAAFTANYPIQYSANVLSLAFGTTTSNTWGGTQTFTNPVAIGSGSGTSTVSGNIDVSGGVKAGTLSGLIYGNAGLLSAATVSSPLSFSAGTLSLSTAGDWTGTFDGQEGAYYLANSFSTTSANYWKTQNNFYSTTSADYWLTTKSTSNLAEGSNLYFTNARADARINATSTIGTLTSAPNLGTLSTTLTGILKATSGVLSTAVAGTDYQVPLAFTYPLVNSSNTISLAFGTTTANAWSSLQTFNGGVKVGSLSGVFYGAAGTLNSVSTSTPTLGTGLSYSGTLGSFIGGTSGTLSISTSTISGSGSNFNADLLDGLDSTYFLANSFSTTSAAYWKTQNNFYSTTSADYWLTGKTTTNLAEGTNLYYTDARVDARINATSTIGTLTSAPNLGTVKTSLTGILKATSGVLSNAVAGTDYENPLTFTYPLQRTTNTISLAFGTTTANSWSALQTFNSIQISGNTFTSLLGSGLSNVGGVLSVSTSSFSGSGSNLNADFLDSLDSTYFLANSFSTTSANYWKGQNNFYSTTSADYWLTGKTTTNLAEGTNLYFTNARADARINATSTIGTLTSAPNLGTVNTALSGLLKASSGALSTAVSGTDYAPATVGTSLLLGNGSGGFSNGSVSSPLTLTGTTLGIQQADNTQPGYLSSTDWTTFNGKQDALTGTTGQFPYFSGTNTVTATSSIFLAANGNVGIGTASPGSQLSLSGDSPFVSLGWANSTEAGGITFNEGGSYQGAIYSTGSAYSSLTSDSLIFDSLQDFEFHPNGNVFSPAAFVIKANGNVGVGTTSPFTKFGVAGNTYLGGNLTATGAIAFTGLSTGLVKSTSGTLSTATAGTDYAPATSGSSLLAGNGAGGFNTVSVSSPLTFVGTTLGIQQANGSQPGYLSSTDWTTFNGKQNALTFSYPLLNTANTISLAFGTTTTNTWSSLQTFNGGVKIGSFSGVLYGAAGTLNSVSTSTPTLGTGLSYSGTLGSFVGGTSGTLSISTSSFSGSGSNFNADLLDGQDGTYYLNRANHTGTQLASTISDFSTTARGLFSSTATGLTYTSGTGVFSLTAGYTIPLTASTTDWNTAYLNRITSATYPLQISSNVLSLAFGTTTANSWSSLQTFNGGITTAGTVTLGSLTGVLHASSGVVSASNVNLTSEVTGTLPVANGGTGSTTLTGLLKGNGTGGVQTAIAGTDYQAAGNYITALTGDVTASGPGSAAATLATVNSNVGSFGGSTAIPTFTVNAKGLITAAGSAAVIAPAGTLTGTTLASGVTVSSLTSLGTLTALTVSGNTSLANATSTNLFSGRLTANTAAFGQTGSTTISSTGALTTPSLSIGSLSGLLYANSGAVAAATISSPLTYSAGTLGIQVANGSQNGYLSSTDWSTFNSKESALTFTYPIKRATNTISLDFGTTTANTWSALNTFSGGIATTYLGISGALFDSSFGAGTNGQILQTTGSAIQWVSTSTLGLGTGTVTSVAASGGTTGLTFSGSPITSSGTLTLSGTLGVANGGTGSTTLSGILLGNGTSAIQTLGLGTGLSLGGGTLSIATSSLFTGTTGQFPYFSGTNTLTATSSLFLATSGNIGIGTTSPGSQLTLDSSSAVGQLYINNMGASNNISINLARNNSVKGLFGIAGATNGIITGSALDDFAVRTAGGNILFSTDSGTTAQLYLKNGGNIGIGTTTPTAKLALAGGNFLQSVTTAPVVAGSVSITSATNGIGTYVQGHYAYSVDAGGGFKLSVIDVSNPSSPTVVGTLTDFSNLNGAFTIKVAGQYAYIASTGSNKFVVVDVSNPSSPTVVGTLSNAAFNGARGLYITGRYAYMVAFGSNALNIIDISNPTAPTLVTSLTSSGNLDAPDSVYVSGAYAYVTSTSNNKLTIVNIANPTAPAVVGSYADVTYLGNTKEVVVAGRYAYVLGQSSNALAVIDVSTPSAPTLAGKVADSTTLNAPKDLFVAGRYAYVTSNGGSRLTVVDISNPAAPFVASSLLDSTNLNNARGVFVSGKYAYVSAGSKFTVVDIAGIDVPSANLGVANTESLSVYENGDVGNDFFIRNGLTVGTGGILSGGALTVLGTAGVNPFTVASSSGTNLLTLTGGGNLGIGSSTPFATVSIADAAGTYPFAIGSSTNPVFTVLPSGSVSVGTITETIASSGFLATRGDLFASGSLASEGVIYTDTGLNLNGASILDSSANLLNLGGTIRAATGNGLSFQTNGASTGRLVIDTSGKVGIGTTTPYAQLSVGGDLVLGASAAGGTPGDLYLPKLGTAAGSFLAVDATGKVIATTTPSGSSLTGTTGQVAYFSGTNTAVGTSTLFISTAGKIGLGTVVPAALLHITGTQPAAGTSGTGAPTTLQVTGITGGDNNATSGTVFGGAGSAIQLTAGNGGAITGTPASGFGGTGGSITLTAGNGGVGGGTSAFAGAAGNITLVGGAAAGTSGGVGGSVNISGGASSISGTTGGSVYIGGAAGTTVGTAGNVILGYGSASAPNPRGMVGVGTTSPWGLLSVDPEAANLVSGAPEFVIGSSSATHLLLNSQGYLGLGTTSPYAQLALGGGNLVLGAATAGGTPGDLYLPKLGTSAGSFLAVDATGKVIATTTPAGGSLTGTTGQVAYFSGTNTAVGTSTLTISTASNVGIGTSTPWGGYKLAVNGTQLVHTTTNYNLTFDSSGISAVDDSGALATFIATGGTATLQATADANVKSLAVGAVRLSTAAGEKLTITSGGNVGIGSTTPTTAFSVSPTAYFGSNVGIGSSSPTAALSLTAGATTAAQGINFGDGTANLYRSAAGTIKTDGNLYIGGGTITALTPTIVNTNGSTIFSNNNGAESFISSSGGAQSDIITTGGRSVLTLGSVVTWAPNSATNSAIYTGLTVSPTVNPGGSNVGGTFYGIRINPTITGTTGLTATYLFGVASGNNDKFVINSTGLVGAGTTTPAGAQIVASNSTLPQVLLTDGSLTSNQWGFRNAGGNLYIATTSPSTNATSTATAFTIASDGGLVAYNATGGSKGIGTINAQTVYANNVALTSDARYKTDIQALDSSEGLGFIQSLAPVSYHWANPNMGTDINFGFLAQDVQKIAPQLVSVGNDKDHTLALNYIGLISPAIKAIQELAVQTSDLSLATTSLATQFASLSASVTTSLTNIELPHALTATNVTADSMTIAQGVSAGTLTTQSANVDGTVSAARYVVPLTANTFTFGSTTISMHAPSEALASGGAVDLYKLAGYATAGVDALAARTDLLAVKIDDLTSRIAALEALHSATTTASTTDGTSAEGALGLTITTIQDALKGLGIIIQKGYLALDSLVTHQLFLVRGEDGTSSTGSEVIPAGATTLNVTNPLVHPSSKIFLTFTSSVDGSWYLSKKQEGSFTITLAKPQPADTEFDYFLLQTDPNAQVAAVDQANQPPAGASEAPTAPASVSQDGGPVVSLNGEAAIQLAQGAIWTDPGAHAVAADGTDLTSSITVAGSVDTNTAGLYTLTYNVVDAAGKGGQASRVVSVLAPTSAPSGGTTVTDNSGTTGGTGSGTSAGSNTGSTASTGTSGGTATTGGTTPTSGDTTATSGGTTASTGTTGTTGGTTADAGGSTGSSAGTTVSAGTDTTPAS